MTHPVSLNLGMVGNCAISALIDAQARERRHHPGRQAHVLWPWRDRRQGAIEVQEQRRIARQPRRFY